MEQTNLSRLIGSNPEKPPVFKAQEYVDQMRQLNEATKEEDEREFKQLQAFYQGENQPSWLVEIAAKLRKYNENSEKPLVKQQAEGRVLRPAVHPTIEAAQAINDQLNFTSYFGGADPAQPEMDHIVVGLQFDAEGKVVVNYDPRPGEGRYLVFKGPHSPLQTGTDLLNSKRREIREDGGHWLADVKDGYRVWQTNTPTAPLSLGTRRMALLDMHKTGDAHKDLLVLEIRNKAVALFDFLEACIRPGDSGEKIRSIREAQTNMQTAAFHALDAIFNH